MLRRNVVIGGLIAGAFLLPTLASAAVNGACSNCHTMHASQDGVVGTPQNTLLTGTGCIGCHATAVIENDATGRGTDSIKAPQVDGSGAALGFINNAGYFNAAGADNLQHNVLGIKNMDAAIRATANLAPGGTFLVESAITAGAPALTCSNCHGASGGHHGPAGANYRLISGNTTTSAQTNYGAIAAAATVASGTRNEVVYNATTMNAFCASCHATFHQAPPHAAAGNQLSAVAGTWLRHPTGISVAVAQGPSVLPMNAAGDTDAVVVGTDGVTTDIVMCLSCHVPHGGPYADLLSFNYASVDAGDGTAAVGCELCHGYGVAGM